MIGAGGRVGSAVALGLSALGKRKASTTGMVSELPVFKPARLIDPGSIVVGGHEIRSGSLLSEVKTAHKRANLFDQDLIRACTPQLRAMQRNIRPGTLYGSGPVIRRQADLTGLGPERTAAQAIERIAADIRSFRDRLRLDLVIVVHVASSEPAVRPAAAHRDFGKLQRALAKPGGRILPTSSLYALAALEAGCPFIDFTPSTGIRVPAIRQRADELGLPYMCGDGKTGETLVKSALAPMFAMRNLDILSWAGQNLLGNRDGEVLRDPRTRASKLRTKDKVVSGIVGKSTATHVGIDYVESLDDWKVAWDYIHFAGFLGTKMSMQFTWQGSDSILAAPLIIDLVRFTELECRRGAGGAMRHLAFFFKDPIDVKEHALAAQWRRLVEHVTGTS